MRKRFISFLISSLFVFAISACANSESSWQSSSSNSTHEHTFNSNAWKYDNSYHWHPSTCGHDVVSNKELHTFSDWTTNKEPSYIEEGKKSRTCFICQYTQTEKIEKIAPPYNTDSSKTNTYYGIEITELPYFSNGLTVVSISSKTNSSITFVVRNDSGKNTDQFCKLYYKVYDSSGVLQSSDHHYIEAMDAGESSYLNLYSITSTTAKLLFEKIEVSFK